MEGTIKKLVSEKGFGFITPEDGSTDVFFHFSGCVDKLAGFKALVVGDKVVYDMQDGQKGPIAVNIEVV